mgnify:CR=1 FL=1
MNSNLTLHKKDYFPHQWSFLTSKKPITGLIAGFGSGKTHSLLVNTFICMVNKQNPRTGKSNGLILYPTYSLADEVFVEPFRNMLDKNGVWYEYNIASHKFKTIFGDLKIYVTNQSHKIVGSSYTYCGVDEIDIEAFNHAERSINKALGRLRGCEDAELYITTTPEGFGYTWHLMVEQSSDDKLLVRGKTTDNKYLPESYIQSVSYTHLTLPTKA